MNPQARMAIELKGVSKSFGAVRAVQNVSLEVPAGTVFGLIGPNGAGKTTTFSMLAGYVRPTDGDVFVLDHRPEAVRSLKGKLGVLPQDAVLPPGERVGEFLLYLARLQGMELPDARVAVKKVLQEVEGADWEPKRCGTLSHGMAKRVGLAQALLGDPDVVLLDEPTAGLDPRVAYEVRQLVKARRGTCTLVISSHNLHELEEVCDAAAILDRGRLVASGTMAELTASSEEIRVQLGAQAQEMGPVEEPIRALAGVTSVAFEARNRELIVRMDKSTGDVEELIRRVLSLLIEHRAPIVGLSKGRGLEQRVMELTEEKPR